MQIAYDFIRVLTVLLVCKRIDSTYECKESNATVRLVKACPRTSQEWRNAVSLKNCGSIQNSCSSFHYHCVMNTWRNETVEVCAPRINIIGRNCAEYNFGGFRIQRNGNVKCAGCPPTYPSTESFQYEECYNFNKHPSENSSTTAPVTQDATSAMLTKESTISLSLSSAKQRLSKQKQPNNSFSKIDEKMIAVICAVVVAVMILVILFIFTRNSWTKHFSLQLKGLCKDKRQTQNTSQETKNSCSNADNESLLTKTPRAVLSKNSEASISSPGKSMHSIV